jgi:oligopeptidase A
MTEHLPNFSKLDIKNYVAELSLLLDNNLKAINRLLQPKFSPSGTSAVCRSMDPADKPRDDVPCAGDDVTCAGDEGAIIGEIVTPQQNTLYTWDNLMFPLEQLDNDLHLKWSVFSHVHAVKNTAELRQCYEDCLPKLSAYDAKIEQNYNLFQAISSIDKKNLDATQQKILNDTLRDFRLSGIDLPKSEQKLLAKINAKLAKLSHKFENNVLDATQKYNLHIKDDAEVTGVLANILSEAKKIAQDKNLPGYIFTLDYPNYHAIITYAQNRQLRETIYKAYATKASKQSSLSPTYDNTKILKNILSLRAQKAEILKFPNYASLSLATKMAKSPDEVMDFLTTLKENSRDKARLELARLAEFGKTLGIKSLKPWDLAFLAEKLRLKDYAVSDETIKTYFPVTKVLTGIFTIIKKLYNIDTVEVTDADVWHPEVKCYRLEDALGPRGFIYLDLFARQHKRGGAWMDDMQGRFKMHDQLQYPIATLTCNFAQDKTIYHNDVMTLLHEFGHCLQHVLTKIDYLNASGINNVEWDAVELPSQFFECWAYNYEALDLLSAHIETGEKIPQQLFADMLKAKNFNAALGIIRQIELASFDFVMHCENDSKVAVKTALEYVKNNVSIMQKPAYIRLQNSFSHIFAGGYAAGYYSYLWAEILSCDAFLRFEDEGIFNSQTGAEFLQAILETGGSMPALEAFIKFRGREPDITTFLKYYDIA